MNPCCRYSMDSNFDSEASTMNEEINLIAAVLFGLALIHTFAAKSF